MKGVANMCERKILPLRGPDRVRKRPAVMFGSDGIDGVISAIKQVLNVFTSEALLGGTKNISIVIREDNSISIKSMDSGMIIDETLVDEKPAWNNVFCELIWCEKINLYGHKENKTPKYDEYMYFDVGMAAVQYASEYMNVTVVRDGMKKSLSFKKGYFCSDLHKEKCNERSYTYIHFKPDPDVFVDTNITTENLEEIMLEIAITIGNLALELTDMRNGQTVSYCYKNGIEDRCKELIGDNASARMYTRQIEASGRDRYNQREYDAISKVALSFVAGTGQVECFHNHRKLKNGGAHLRKLQSEMQRYLVCTMPNKFRELNVDMKLWDNKTIYKNMLNHFVIVIETACSGKGTSKWENGTRSSITNKMITDMTSDLLNDFDFYLRVNAKKILDCLGISHT